MIIETLTFRLGADVDEVGFLAADSVVQAEFYSPAPGFVRRTTARGDDGDWLVATFWASASLADKAAEREAADPAVRGFLDFVDHATMRSRRFETLD